MERGAARLAVALGVVVLAAACAGRVSSGLDDGGHAVTGGDGVDLDGGDRGDSTMTSAKGRGEASPGDAGSADGPDDAPGGSELDAWTEAAANDPPTCAVSANAPTYQLYGEPGYLMSALPSGACHGLATCRLLISTGPFCGDETVSQNDFICECVRETWDCVGTASSGGVVDPGWCDGGNGTNDAG